MSSVTLLYGSSTLKWAQTQLCRPSGYGMDLFLVPYSRVLRYRWVKRAQLIAEGYTERSPTPWKMEWYWAVACSRTRFLCILHVKNVVGISLANIVGKINTLHHFPTPWVPTFSRVCNTSLQYDYSRSRLSTQIVYAITFSFFVRFVWNFHTIFYTHTALF